MKILCIIDHFGSGGAQRQMVNLACGLQAKGHQVEVFIYYPKEGFFRPTIDKAEIVVHEMVKGSGFSFMVLLRLMMLLRKTQFDGVISFLGAPNLYAEFACLVSPASRLIVSERSSHHDDKNVLVAFSKRFLHILANGVIANSYSHAVWLRRYPWLKKKVKTIYNGYPFALNASTEPRACPPLALLVIGRVGPEKNGLRLIQALNLFFCKHRYIPHVSWVGKRDTSPAGIAYCRELDKHLLQYPEVKASWSWLGERSDIPELLERHSAVVHPSLYEGLPNAVCEAFIAAKPVIASSVCDHPLLVEEGIRGHLCDPLSPASICEAIERFVALTPQERQAMGRNARRYANEHLTLERMVNEYEALLN